MPNQTLAVDLVAAADEIAKEEAFGIARRQWSDATAKRVAVGRIREAGEQIDAIVVAFSQAAPSSTDTAAVLEAQYEAALETISLVLRTAASAEVRLGQLQGVRRACDEHLTELSRMDSASPASRTKDATDAISMAKAAVKSIKAFTDDPFKCVDGAVNFWNKTWDTLASKSWSKPLSNLTVREGWVIYDQLFTANKVSGVHFLNMSRFLGIAAAGLIVATVLVRTLADEANWAPTLAKAGLSTAAGIVAGTVITGAAVNVALAGMGTAISSAMTALGSAATVTIEVPPLAAFFIATGVVLLIGIAAEALFEFLIDTWFGGKIPPSMRLEMASSMTSSMSSQMSLPMFSSMSSAN